MRETLDALIEGLGYRRVDTRWAHPKGRTLVSVGDLLDRGPDSLGCCERLAELVDAGCGRMILGNHELNALHYMADLREHSPKNREQFAATLAQIEARPRRWDAIEDFLMGQPTRLLLDEGRLRVIHACWDARTLERLPEHLDATILRESAKGGALEDVFERYIKGPEESCPPYQDPNGHTRRTRRLPWWRDYPSDAPKVAFGHYWFPWASELPDRAPGWLGPGENATCLDFSAGKGGPLLALRYPEMEFVTVPNRDVGCA